MESRIPMCAILNTIIWVFMLTMGMVMKNAQKESWEAVFIETNEMIRALRAEHAFSERFLSYMLSRNIRMEEDLVDQLCQCSERRLARALLQLAGKWGPRRARRFAGISQTTLAKMTGTTRSRVNFFMNKFRTLGFIKYDGALSESAGIRVNTSLLAEAFCK